ncbi:M1 family metallopeptidase [Kordiimonas sp. SCSIO 12610]|uniref:M1 family metallopeptidase n=1 Tax=Kordiimonas sp. SCSIO 12610 TaxID=2829597 RepID=UPI00210DE731|nr:M1 family metallopeptidase [Kordiimonas sp. SCSIO 12610]UTW55920.1 M1 family metallopeptidase [Kordiimonas sp. SCSIO 12610]
MIFQFKNRTGTIARGLVTAFAVALTGFSVQAGEVGSGAKKFKQLGTELPTPNVYRDATGAPGPNYWQQSADYKINVTLDENNKRITGSETITYTNNSPSTLRYLWVQLDQNRFNQSSIEQRSATVSRANNRPRTAGSNDRFSYNQLRAHQSRSDTEHGYKITAVKRSNGGALTHTIVDTMMRIDLPTPLASGATTTFSIDWEYNIIEEAALGGRGGYERFEDDETYIYFLAQWFPRMAAFTDYTGWQHKAFLGRGEFTLEFGDYDVSITVPEDHIVSGTGVLQNPRDVLTAEQRSRLDKAKNAKEPVFIVTPEEAAANEAEKSTGTKTWRFVAENVRDFAWSSSRKFIWDAMGHKQDDDKNPLVMAMSFYPNEAEPIWSKYSTHSVAHTMNVYSKMSFAYPYPTAQSVNTWERGGMEYPMITFNGYRPTKQDNVDERTYTRNIKYGLIGVIIHEVGHIYFPMVVNSDERQWTWMDEGLNTFLEYVAELEWEENYPAFAGKTNLLDTITTYMRSSNQVPIMTQSDSILQFGPNAYSKPAAALTVLRETVMGRELFDHAFREYSHRWKFKRPTPSDFFRTMEDASGVDLDWFWRGWFYTTDHVDVGVASVREYKVFTGDPDIDNPIKRAEAAANEPEAIQQIRNRAEGIEMYIDGFGDALKDVYNDNDRFTTSNKDRNSYQSYLEGLTPWQKRALERAIKDDQFIYFVDYENVGGLVTPLPVTLTFADGSTEDMMVPAEVWRRDAEFVTQMYIRDKQVVSVEVDRAHQIADADHRNNTFPQKVSSSRLKLFKSDRKARDLMADLLVKLKAKKEAEKASAGEETVPLAAAQ